MELLVLGSSSSGNCYVLRADSGESLIIECGLAFKKIKEALDWNIRKAAACLVSHRHRDHSKAFAEITKAGIRILALQDVKDSFPQSGRLFFTPIQPMKGYKANEFKIFTLPMYHTDPDGTDCPCLGFIISHDEMGRLLFATDTVTIDFNVRGINHIMIEANYSDSILQKNIDNGRIHKSERNRLLQSHMEVGTTVKVLQNLDTDSVNEVILLHLSERNANPIEFKKQVAQETGLPVYVAEKGFRIDLTQTAY